ncbi:Gti1/Pac2 family-domain-containing protein [Coprinopsis sp. MPI-PUGE-AT-0042]|nr:Gti1/Pac2 family-domain-containing protein [Coprinopsis sp. MPI-PUGE-AT-0042]
MPHSVVTHPSLHIRDAHDAHIVLEAVRLNILPLIKRRLLSNEREDLRSGQVYVWEEAQDDGGLLRWTDGRRWSQSRMRGDYLFYEEKIETTQDERDAKAARRACRAADPAAIVPPPVRRKDRPTKPNGLTKQTYSVTVNLQGSGPPRKWHVVAYFSGNDYTRLPVVENYEYLRNIRVPPGVYLSNKVLCARSDRFSYYSDDNDLYEDRDMPSSPSSPSLSPTPLHSSPATSLPRLFMPSTNQNRIVLPPISTLDSKGRLISAYGATSPLNYTPLSPEDKRALESFRVCL